LKIVGLGLFSGRNAYLKDPWNIMDFTILISQWMSQLSGASSGTNSGTNSSATKTTNSTS